MAAWIFVYLKIRSLMACASGKEIVRVDAPRTECRSTVAKVGIESRDKGICVVDEFEIITTLPFTPMPQTINGVGSLCALFETLTNSCHQAYQSVGAPSVKIVGHLDERPSVFLAPPAGCGNVYTVIHRIQTTGNSAFRGVKV